MTNERIIERLMETGLQVGMDAASEINRLRDLLKERELEFYRWAVYKAKDHTPLFSMVKDDPRLERFQNDPFYIVFATYRRKEI